jgi:hypothetical protein
VHLLSQFAPWILFALLSNLDWRLALLVGLAVQVALVLARRPRRAGVLDGAMLVFFVVMGAIAFIDPSSAIRDHVNTISAGWLALVAAISIVVGHPFTLDFSSDGASPEVLASPRFLAANRTITAAWSATFAGMAVAGVVAAIVDVRSVSTVATVILLLVAVRFTKRYPERVHRQAVAAATSPVTV